MGKAVRSQAEPGNEKGKMSFVDAMFWLIAGLTGISAVMVVVTQNIVRARFGCCSRLSAFLAFTSCSGRILSGPRSAHCLRRRDFGAGAFSA